MKYLFLILLISFEGLTQTGPGGVGTNNGTSDLIIWYRSDNGISTTGTLVNSWANSAGISAFDISETGSSRPTLVGNTINNYDEISFSGGTRLRTGLTLTTSNFIIDQASSFIVTKADNTSQRTSAYSTDGLTGNRFQAHIPWANVVYFDIGNCCGSTSRLQVGSLSDLTSYSIFTYDANPSSGKQLYRNGTLLQNRAGSSTYSSHSTHRFTIGAFNFAGDITELVIYRTTRNEAERVIVDNYLAAKFNQPLNSNDFYTQDDNGSGNFDHKVAGIGQASNGTNHTDSKGTGIVNIKSPTNLNDNEFLFWGENMIDSNYDFSKITIGKVKYRLNTSWRVSETGDVGNVNFSVNSSELNLIGVPLSVPLKLIRSTTSDFNTVTAEYDLSLSDGVYSSIVEFNNNDYFTLQVVPISDLSITSIVDKAIAKKGDIVYYTIKIKNDGPNDSSGVIVKSKLPNGLQYDLANSIIPSGTTYNSNTGIWDFVSIAINNGETITLTLAAIAQTENVLLTNSSEIIAADQEDIDSIPNNGN